MIDNVTHVAGLRAGRVTFEQAILAGYCATTARALQRKAHREFRWGESPACTAERLVRAQERSATHER